MFAYFKPELPSIIEINNQQYCYHGVFLRTQHGEWQVAIEFSISDPNELEDTLNFLLKSKNKIKVH